MHVITHGRLKEFWEKHPNAKTGLQLWYKRTTLANWRIPTDLSQDFPSADPVGNLTVFDICGNNYRLIVYVDYKYQKVFIRAVLTHAEYDRGGWKKDPWF